MKELSRIVSSIPPVSYTHLDVYKRQVLTDSHGLYLRLTARENVR